MKATILCASDPYAVIGVETAFKRGADPIAGTATSTDAGIELIERLSGIQARDLLKPESRPWLMEFLKEKLERA